MKFVLDYGLFFKNPEGVGGTLRLVGWTLDEECHNGASALPRRFVLKHQGEPIGEFSCNTTRADVVQCYPSAPLDCGYDVLLPLQRDVEDTSEIHIETAERGSWLVIGRFIVTSADVVFDRYIGSAPLTPRQKNKLRNLFRNERERIHHVRRLQSNPIYLLIDPSFSCQLRCPSCHSDMLREQGYSMRNLRPEVMQRLLDAYGETLIQVYFANWGEPLLNKQFEALVALMKRYDIWVTTSTNLSLSLSDARVETLVRSGIDHMILSIDGTTQESYEKYRRRGNLSLVLENVRQIVAAKRRLQSATPLLRWQFLIFPWNRHEIDEARELAKTIGCDEFDAHDGAMHPRVVISKETRQPGTSEMLPGHGERLLELREEMIARKKFFGCDHLYHQLSINSDGSVHPCCYVVAPEHFIAQVGGSEIGDLFNHEILQDARQLLGSAETIQAGRGYEPCLNCKVVTGSGGHVESSLSFFSAFEFVTGRSLRSFLPD